MVKSEYILFINSILLSNTLVNPSNPLYGKAVIDCYKYQLVYINNKWETQKFKNTTEHIIVFILESPHKSEFKNGRPLEPLKNGNQYFKCINDLISKSSNFKLDKAYIYSIYLMNAIQFQCSLGLEPTYYRDYIFLYYWYNLNNKNDFENRLLSFCQSNYSKIDYIINCVTIGDHKNAKTIYNSNNKSYDNMPINLTKFITKYCNLNKTYGSLKEIVQESIENVTKAFNIKLLKGNHPSRWFSSNSKIE